MIHALDNSVKTIVYPSLLYPGKVWVVSPSSENISQRDNIWQHNDVNTPRYRPLEEETPHSPDARAQMDEYYVAEQADRSYRGFDRATEFPKYRSELEHDMTSGAQYRSEMDNLSNQSDSRHSHHVAPRRRPYDLGRDNFSDPSRSPSYWQPQAYQFYDHNFSQYMPPVWDLMDDPSFSGDYAMRPPLSPDAWINPYIRNNFSSQKEQSSPTSIPVHRVQIPLRNDSVLPEKQTPELTISKNWIPAPNSALVDSEEFHSDYATVPLRPPYEDVATRPPLTP
ncbi:MAG: hypothetical protein R3E08_04770 [Thiotrichaceae bacterium]